MNNKKGSAILEISIVLPLVIIVLICLIYLNIILFSLVLEKTSIEREAGIVSGYASKTFYTSSTTEQIKKSNWLLENEGLQFYKKVRVTSMVEHKDSIFKALKFSNFIDAESTVFDEASFIRNSKLLKESVSAILKERK